MPFHKKLNGAPFEQDRDGAGAGGQADRVLADMRRGDGHDRVRGPRDEQAPARGSHHPVMDHRRLQPVRPSHAQQGKNSGEMEPVF